MLIKKLPIQAVQEAVYELLEEGQTTKVYRDVGADAESPYITLGRCSATPLDSKNMVLWDCKVDIEVWSTGKGEGEIVESDATESTDTEIPAQAAKIYETVNDVNYLVSKYGLPIDEQKTGYRVLDAKIIHNETFPTSDLGYHATMTAEFSLTNI